MKRKTIQRALTLKAVQTMQSHPTADGASRSSLFQVHLCSLCLKLCLNLLCLCLGSAFFHYLRSAVNKLFRLFQPKSCNLADNLDYFNLGSSRRYQFYIEFCFLYPQCTSVEYICIP